MVPSKIEMRVAPIPALTLVSSASRTPWLSRALVHQCNVHSCGGQEKVLEALNELIKTTNSGVYKNKSVALVNRPNSTLVRLEKYIRDSPMHQSDEPKRDKPELLLPEPLLLQQRRVGCQQSQHCHRPHLQKVVICRPRFLR